MSRETGYQSDSNAEFLFWIHDRLHMIFKESPSVDYVTNLGNCTGNTK